MSGVNEQGIEWTKDKTEDKYFCTYYAGDGITYTKTFKGVSKEYIEKLTPNSLM